jgi:hypothetical protein
MYRRAFMIFIRVRPKTNIIFCHLNSPGVLTYSPFTKKIFIFQNQPAKGGLVCLNEVFLCPVFKKYPRTVPSGAQDLVYTMEVRTGNHLTRENRYMILCSNVKFSLLLLSYEQTCCLNKYKPCLT